MLLHRAAADAYVTDGELDKRFLTRFFYSNAVEGCMFNPGEVRFQKERS